MVLFNKSSISLTVALIFAPANLIILKRCFSIRIKDEMLEQIPFFVAFTAGVASFLSPCVLPLVPVYLASMAGPEILNSAGSGIKRRTTFMHSLSFVLGFSIVFSLWGAGAGLVGSALATHIGLVRQVAGVILVLLGILMLAATRVSWLNYEARLNMSLGKRTGYFRSVLTGGLFCLAWTPCLGGPIVGILSLAGTSGTVWRGTYLLALYSLGLGIPFLAMGIAFDFVAPLLKGIYRFSTWVYAFSGILLVGVGMLILTNRMAWFYF